ncbi:hypothetical protein E1B28_005481 [Marasmius oreades]|uniref:Uncharacterized protein n=1 Tax=Marasmius oreades TaxID=181124 RepID=A0A9P7S3S6_9AGAR|nr:uncharacterized protein E1B28_005481 [Marasmius oreades]KAG7094658.1 hypothetical protein E1B28_005481 [Marasmius oreades]
MVAFKSLIVLAFAAVTLGAPNVRRQLEEGADCTYVVTPSANADGINLSSEVNFMIGDEVAIETNGPIFNGGLKASVNEDGSVTVSGKIAADNLKADELKALLTSWPGNVTLHGLPQNGNLLWTVNSVTCQ